MNAKTILLACALFVQCGGLSPGPGIQVDPPSGDIYTKVPNPTYTIRALVPYITDVKGRVTSDPSAIPGPALISGAVTGQYYAALAAACPEQTPVALSGAFGNPFPIATPIQNAMLGLTRGAQLPRSACVIIENCLQGVCAYQAFALTFKPN